MEYKEVILTLAEGLIATGYVIIVLARVGLPRMNAA